MATCRLRAWLLAAALAAAAPSRADLLFLEDPLRAFAPMGPDRMRLEVGAEYYGDEGWTGLRNLARLRGSRGAAIDWALTLPWLYSSLYDRGETGRGNLRGGASLRLLGSVERRLRLGAEVWLPFADDRLRPLQQRRGGGRLALLGDWTEGPLISRLALAVFRDLPDLGGEVEDEAWPARWSADLRVERRLSAGLAVFLEGGVAEADAEPAWRRLGGGAALGWGGGNWRAELAGDLDLADAEGAAGYDYRICLRLFRDFPPPPPPPEPGAGEAPVAPDGAAGTDEAP
ncbi:MAG: hypothetical protein JW819_03335 [Candidatus Krumholzibacteriota bacterium]|nr:hypothetical protein [Candidatus Krumholzibacteriota bacterium]